MKEVFWTAGKESNCTGKFEWCSNQVFFSLSQKVSLDTVGPNPSTKRCVSGKLENYKVKLSAADCEEKKKFMCEVEILKEKCNYRI